MKRYAVFTFENYYPGGGWNDFQGAYDSVEEADAVRGVTQIVDLETGEVVYGEVD
jgi:hypothetical protein